MNFFILESRDAGMTKHYAKTLDKQSIIQSHLLRYCLKISTTHLNRFF